MAFGRQPAGSGTNTWANSWGLAFYLGSIALLVLNRVRYPYLFSTTATVLVALAVLVGLFGAVWFGRRLVARGP